ncbi:leucine-rich repeat domain-containing protein [Winogradskyella eximia]|uniref:leucine-rich repeat domain-containing protein n=1 Tax=Winogradskyella eximia TaxID=262006 RepID=UPI0015F2971B|nr:T9SS type A sorting domain-containing protein [Winogradskyella eximia]
MSKTKLLSLILLILTLSSSAQTQIATGASSPSGLVVVGDYIYTVNRTNSSLVRANKTQVGTNNFETVVTNMARSGTVGNLFGIYDSVYTPGIAYGTMTYTDVSAGTAFPVYNSPYIVNMTYSISNVFYYGGLNYIANSASGSAELIEHYSLSGGNLIATLPVDYQYISDVTTDGSIMYFSTTTGSIYQIDLAATTPVATLVTSGLGVVKGIHFADDYLYFLNASQVRKVHKSTLVVTAVSSVPGGGVAMEIDGYDIYAANTYGSIYKINDPDLAPCIVNIPDVNFKAALVADTAINTNGDTEIQCSEASAFTGAINVANQSISDLTGIEAFIELTELYCADNSLSTLDVTNNTSLTALQCQNNLLTSIDVSNNISLFYLDIKNNSINSLDVSNNTSLEIFYCNNNALSSLDVTNNVSLTMFYCQNNTLTSLDVSNNTSLVNLYCNDNSISSLDVSNHTSLVQLLCYNNSISTLNVSNSTSLNQLLCYSNSLSSLNLANGNNSSLAGFVAVSNPDLTCIQIDAGFTPPANWQTDTTASYSDDCAALSVNDFNINSISLQPNPTTSMLNIEMTQSLKQASVYSMLGKEVLKSENKKLDVSSLENGVFLIKIEDENGNVSIKRFIKQ